MPSPSSGPAATFSEIHSRPVRARSTYLLMAPSFLFSVLVFYLAKFVNLLLLIHIMSLHKPPQNFWSNCHTLPWKAVEEKLKEPCHHQTPRCDCGPLSVQSVIPSCPLNIDFFPSFDGWSSEKFKDIKNICNLVTNFTKCSDPPTLDRPVFGNA